MKKITIALALSLGISGAAFANSSHTDYSNTTIYQHQYEEQAKSRSQVKQELVNYKHTPEYQYHVRLFNGA